MVIVFTQAERIYIHLFAEVSEIKQGIRRTRCFGFIFLLGFLQIMLYCMWTLPYKRIRASAPGHPTKCVIMNELNLDPNDHDLLKRAAGRGKSWKKDEQCARLFLSDYVNYCRGSMIGSITQKPDHNFAAYANDRSKCLCPCVPATLEGPINVNNSHKVTTLTQHMDGVTAGRWAPPSCTARHRTAIIIPYRDREYHLLVLLGVLHPMLQRQQIDYTIYVAEQIRPASIFNKAMVMNSAFSEVKKRGRYNCFLFHDVDMIPMDDRNMYTCSDTPRHVGAFVDKWGYRVFYEKMFGGAVAFQQRHFELVNGFSNGFYGWGGEDDDMFRRVKARNIDLHPRFPRCVGKYRMLRHRRDRRNPSTGNAHLGWQYRPGNYRKNGLNTLNYTVVGIEEHDLFTRLMFELPDPPTYIHTRKNSTGAFRSTTPVMNGYISA